MKVVERRRGQAIGRASWQLSRMRGVAALFGIAAVLGASPSSASKVEVFSVDGYRTLSAGELDGVRLRPDGRLELGPRVREVAKGLEGPIVAAAAGPGGAVFVATSRPAKIWRVDGPKPKLVASVEEPLITALVPFGKNALAAVCAPKGRVRVISTSGKELSSLEAPDGVELLLDAATLDGVLYVVGGGEEGVLLRAKKGKPKLEIVARTERKFLRSIAARKSRRGPNLVVGTADRGHVYAVDLQAPEKRRLRTLFDAAADEVVDLTIDRSGRVFGEWRGNSKEDQQT